MQTRNLLINATVVFVFCSLLEMTLHECGHFLAALSFGETATLYHNYVHYGNDIPTTQRIIFASAGPGVSLLIGILFHWLLQLRCKPMRRMFCSFMSATGYIGFFGYLLVAPFFDYGDTGYVLRTLGFPIWFIIAFAVGGGVALYFIMASLAKYFISLMSERTAISLRRRKEFIASLILYPVLIGIAITTLLNLPVPTFLSLLAPLCSPFSLLWVYSHYLYRPLHRHELDENETVNQKIYPVWIVLLVVIIAINRLLVCGISL